MDVTPGLGGSPPLRSRAPSQIPPWHVVGALAAAFVLAPLVGQLTGEIARSITHAPDNALTASVVIPSLIVSQLALLAIALWVPLAAARPIRDALGLQTAPAAVIVATMLGTVMLGPLGDRFMTLLSEHFPKLTLGMLPRLNELAQRLPLALLWPTIALLPGLAEELLFRGLLQRSLRPGWRSVLVSGCTFALFHVDPVHIVGVLPLGLFLAWASSRSCTTVTIVAHVMNNSLALLALKHTDLEVGYGSETPLPTRWLLMSLVGFVFAAWSLWRLTPERDSSTSST
ncbi:MAG: hypothetical protein RL701_993 [Pseudomonadota bacterium]